MCGINALEVVMHPSSARLGSAQIQLEQEVFQLGSAQLVSFLSQLALQKLGSYEPKLGKIGNQIEKLKYCLLFWKLQRNKTLEMC